MISLSDIFKRQRDVRYRILEDEAVVVCQDAAELVVLNETGARVLHLLDERMSVDQIIDTMAGEFLVDRPDLERDVLAFLQELADLGVTEKVAG